MRRFVALVALSVLVLTGCAALPMQGPVMVGGPILSGESEDFEFLPSGPVEGATQQEILEGFIAAGSAAQNGYRIARSYLTEGAANEWNPAAETIVRTAQADIGLSGATALTYTFGVKARVSASGNYQAEAAGSKQTLEFRFQEVDGEWRISELPDVVVVSEVTFAAAFQEYTLYFYDTYRTHLIPDVRMFARQGDPVSSVARAVIGGPSPYLSSAVGAFAATAKLVTTPVGVINGRATVDVSDEILSASAEDQRAMLTQMAASLQGIVGVAAVSFSVNQTSIDVTPASFTAAELEPTVDPRPLVVVDGELGYLNDATLQSLDAHGEAIMGLNPTSISTADSQISAVGTRSGVYRVAQNDVVRISAQRPTVAPQIDSSGVVWWVNPSSPARVSTSGSQGSTSFGGSWPQTARITHMEVSRDNSRLAILVSVGGATHLYVSSIERDKAGFPMGLGIFRELPLSADSARGLAWASSTHIAIIIENAGMASVALASVGGMTISIGQPREPATIVGGNNGRQGITILSEDGVLWQPRGEGWQSTGVIASLLATQR
ncbi:sporulation and spore germination protein [Microbacteriaceae bacterium MWH-Ta3]|nr:sporulation and spore germination protein [Microbacteriaceae bacterium MWH-Ta3]